MARQTKPITVTLDPTDLEFFENMAIRTDVSKSRLIRQAMREFREKYALQGQPERALGITLAQQASS